MTTGIAMNRRSANGDVQFLALAVPELIIPMSTGATLTDNPAALTFYSATNACLVTADCKGMVQARLTARIATVSASAANPRLRLMYRTSFDATAANWLQAGKSGQIEASMFTGQTVGDSGWIELAELAKVDNVLFTLATIGGDAAADPVVGNVVLHLR